MYKKYVKRIIDIIVSLIVLIVISPVYLILSILIKLIDKGPIFYIQSRTGKDGNNFKIYKFRTMKNGKVTKMGKYLRMTSLDEIPQFLNILKGDMSIVGPRPWVPDYYENFTEKQKERTRVKPGLVGLAQVNGRRAINIFEKINFDIYYVRNLNLWLDLKIILKSFKIIISNDNISEGNAYINNEIAKLKNQHKILNKGKN